VQARKVRTSVDLTPSPPDKEGSLHAGDSKQGSLSPGTSALPASSVCAISSQGQQCATNNPCPQGSTKGSQSKHLPRHVADPCSRPPPACLEGSAVHPPAHLGGGGCPQQELQPGQQKTASGANDRSLMPSPLAAAAAAAACPEIAASAAGSTTLCASAAAVPVPALVASQATRDKEYAAKLLVEKQARLEELQAKLKMQEKQQQQQQQQQVPA